MRCFQNRAGTSTATVAAGSELGFVAAASISHFGPVQFYMAKVPDNADINTWEASGNVWFKAASISAQGSPLGSGTETWPTYRKCISLRGSLLSHHMIKLTAEQKSLTYFLPSQRTHHPANTSCASNLSRCTRPKALVEHKSICLAHRSRLQVVGMASQDRLWRSQEHIMRMIQG